MLLCYNTKYSAGVAHLVERHLAKVEVASSSLVARSKFCRALKSALFFLFYARDICLYRKVNQILRKIHLCQLTKVDFVISVSAEADNMKAVISDCICCK